MWFGVVTLFPAMFMALTDHGVTGGAKEKRHYDCHFFNPRDYADNPQGYIDDKPYGGGPGMVMQAPPVLAAIAAAKAAAPPGTPVIALTPAGQVFKQSDAQAFAGHQGLIFVAGRYEGIDQRVLDKAVDTEYSIGDYVLTGGELPAMVMMDAILRYVPGVLGDATSTAEESFSQGLLEYPQYTRPRVVAGQAVPAVLCSGDHKAIRQWRLKAAQEKTLQRRPELVLPEETNNWE